MAVASIKDLLEAGVHFGHQTKRWNPKMKKYIYEARNGIYIINLQKTAKCLNDAYRFVENVVASGGRVLFVGTKKQAKEIMKQAAGRTGMYYVSERWLGGMLTNLKTIRASVKRLKELEEYREKGTLDLLSKKEAASLRREMEKLHKNLDGIKEMDGLPDCVFLVDPKKEHLAVAEARRLNIPVVGLVDTNCDPDMVDLVIPGNDDAIRSVQVIVSSIVEAVMHGKGQFVKDLPEKEAAKEDMPPELGPVPGSKKPAKPAVASKKRDYREKAEVSE
ncbi:MAG: 30S ribosomal protein S2 [Candidatus Auribacter fodinae]|jgi:small subunit ribosomal protein S2|uniref:Small ribosomal subunit protein uS2 n=1 Tax=Candidatus Auribacter fodinae TaxID=2093366 RepID=A0A3A4QWK1_9BACT|nr:MAG: 30S ribosomal protein S2 [Candidatus Auribacter fodinae]